MTLNRRWRRAGVLTALTLCLAGVGLMPPAAAASSATTWGKSATVKVVKKVFRAGTSPHTAVPAGGWEFTTSTGGASPTSGRTADRTGAVTFTVNLGGQRSETVAFAETPQQGFTLYPVNRWNAYCMANGRPVWSANDGPHGFKVDVKAGAYITCTVLNKASKPPAKLTLVKRVINDDGRARPRGWILHAIPETGHANAIEGRSGSASVTNAAAVPGVAYELSESDGPSNYKLTDLRCVLTGTSTEVPITDNSITMGLDEYVTCTFTNKETEGPSLPVTGNITGPVAGIGVGIFLLGLGMFIAAHKWRRLTDD